MANIIRAIPEPNKTVDVVRECDVVVVGGGPGGIGAAAALSIDQGVSVRRVDFASLRKWLISHNVPLPGAYPARYNRAATGPAAVYENPDFRERNEGVRTQQNVNH